MRSYSLDNFNPDSECIGFRNAGIGYSIYAPRIGVCPNLVKIISPAKFSHEYFVRTFDYDSKVFSFQRLDSEEILYKVHTESFVAAMTRFINWLKGNGIPKEFKYKELH